MQDDVPDAIRLYARRRGEQRNERQTLYVQELTSRRTQKEVRDMLHEMAIPAGRPEALDVMLASNMLSVGVDIPRLGLMVVNGQPKGIAELHSINQSRWPTPPRNHRMCAEQRQGSRSLTL